MRKTKREKDMAMRIADANEDMVMRVQYLAPGVSSDSIPACHRLCVFLLNEHGLTQAAS
jgi:hypothetical protein